MVAYFGSQCREMDKLVHNKMPSAQCLVKLIIFGVVIFLLLICRSCSKMNYSYFLSFAFPRILTNQRKGLENMRPYEQMHFPDNQ